MYLSIDSFAANWLLLCLIIPFYSAAEKSDWIPYNVNDPVHYRFRPRAVQPELVSQQQFRSNVPKSRQYNVYRPEYNSVQPGLPSNNHHSEDNVKVNVARSMPKDQLREVYRPYYYSELVGNREESAARSGRKVKLEIDEDITKKMNMLDKMLSEDIDENDVDENTAEDEIIAEMNISEETKRVVRQVRRHRPGFFWTLARLAFETYNDTRSAIKQISSIINQTIEPDPPATRRPVSSHPLMAADTTTTIAPSTDQNDTSVDAAGVNATTTMAPFRLTPINLQKLILRNVRGLVRLFNIEWQDALNQSEINTREFNKDLGNQIGSFLRDNPNAS